MLSCHFDRVENMVGKGEMLVFPHDVFESLTHQGYLKWGLPGKGLIL